MAVYNSSELQLPIVNASTDLPNSSWKVPFFVAFLVERLSLPLTQQLTCAVFFFC